MKELKLSKLCLIALVTIGLIIGVPSFLTVPSGAESPGWIVEGEGHCFEVTNSTYLNVTLCSTEVVNVTLESIPEVVSFAIQAVENATSTDITMSGFEPNRMYYRHEDGYLKESFVADEDGNYHYTQDLSTPHHVFIAEEAGTKHIKDAANGGDCYLIGTWDGLTKTCTLTMNVNEMIVLDSNGLTLDGDGWSITGFHDYGVYASGKSALTVKNIVVRVRSYSIFLHSSSGSTVSGNTVSTWSWNSYGIRLSSSSGSTVSGNTVSTPGQKSYGILLSSSSGSTVSGNTVSSHTYGIYLSSSSGSMVSGNTVSTYNYGIRLHSSSGNTVSGNTVSSHTCGIYLSSSSGNTVSENIITSSSYGIRLYYSGSNTVSENTVASSYGIGITSSPGVILLNNAMTGGGITIEGSLLSDWNTHTIDTLNMVNGKPVQYCKNTVGETISAAAGQVILASCSNMIVENQDIVDTYMGIVVAFGSGNVIRWNTVSGEYSDGIYLYYSDSSTVSENTILGEYSYGIRLSSSGGSTVSGNTVSDGHYGISLSSSGGNTVSGNTVSGGYYGIHLSSSDSSTISENIVASSRNYGIYLYHSDSNTIFHNDFVFNNLQLGNVGSTNTWNSPALEGNYWSDYNGLDDGSGDRTAGDGIGDTGLPHQGVDSYPLMNPWRFNYPPVVSITAPPSGAIFPTGAPISFSGYFTDPEVEDTHEASWSFDGIAVPGTVTESDGSGTVSDEITFDVAGIYRIKLIVTDDKGNVGTADTVDGLLAQIVVYDPGAFVTGGGWIDSPEGAYEWDPYVTGKATFAFVTKYRKGADVPTGETEFRFQTAGFSFRSESYDWLVCGGRKCKFKGSGTLTIKWKWGGPWDEEYDVGFMITAIDGSLQGGDGKDRFRIKIWLLGYEWYVIYDNMGLYWWDDDTDPPEIGGGSIVIHKG